MANWWDNLISGLEQASSEGKIGYTPQYASYQPGFRNSIVETGIKQRRQPTQYTPEMTAAADKQARDLFNLGGAGTLRTKIGNELGSQAAASSAANQAPEFDEFMASLGLGGGGGSAPLDLSGYDTLLSDVAAREQALGGRKAEQEAFIAGIIEAARGRGTDAQGRIKGRYEEMGQTAADQRAGEINSIQNSELQRLAQRNAAREALGVAGGADIASAEAESAGAGITARGDAATRDAQIQQSIESQQYANQIAGLDPMQAQYGMALNSAYEDRLAQLASERAQIQAQVAQAKAAPRGGGGGLSISDYSQAYGLYNDMFGAGPGPDVSGTGLQVVQQYAQADPRNAELYGRILKDLPGVMSQYGLGIGGKNMDPTELANAIIAVRPDYGDAYLFIRDLVGSGN